MSMGWIPGQSDRAQGVVTRSTALTYRAEQQACAEHGDSQWRRHRAGLGWYEHRSEPALFRSISPAWGDENLLELATEIRTRLFLAHVRAGTGTPVQQTNCHPFRYRNWLFVHNGYVAGYQRLRRDLLLAVHPDLFGNIAGSTDSELLFHLALTFGLTDDPITGIARMAGFVEATAAATSG